VVHSDIAMPGEDGNALIRQRARFATRSRWADAGGRPHAVSTRTDRQVRSRRGSKTTWRAALTRAGTHNDRVNPGHPGLGRLQSERMARAAPPDQGTVRETVGERAVCRELPFQGRIAT
jgi:hypothetical protein